MIKDIIKNLKPSSTLLINEVSNKMEKEGKKVFKFGFGQSPFKVPEDVVAELKNHAHQNSYLPMQGLKELRDSIAKYMSVKKKIEYKSENIIVGPGSKELMFLLHVLFDGEIILPAPSWVSYGPQAIIGRNKVKWLECSRENNWFPTATELEKLLKENKDQKYLLFLNSPNNPSGQICENLDELAALSKKYNLYFLSDEIYSELSFEDNYQSISTFAPDKTIISTGLSKWCGAGGWRLGYFIIPDSLSNITNQLKVLASETFSSVSAPIQYAAISAFKNDHTDYVLKSKKILKGIGEYVYKNLKSNNVIMNKPMGGFYLMPEFLNKTFKTSSEMCSDLLNKKNVAILPGSEFGFLNDRMIARLSFTDFDGNEFMKKTHNEKINNEIIEKFAPKVVEGVIKLKNWSTT